MKPRCPTCRSDYPLLLGRMGGYVWFRCRYCGLDFYRPARHGAPSYDPVAADEDERWPDAGWGADRDTLAQLGSDL